MGVIARWLRGAADLIDPPMRDPMWARAAMLVQEQDSRYPDRSGEAKRHAVYGRLVKDYPTRPRHEIGLVIEHVVAESR